MDNFDYKKFLTENKMTRNSRLLNEEASNGFDVAFSSEGGDALVITHTASPDANLLITADKEDINQETVVASGEFVLGGKTLYWLIATA